ncbi:MAG: patatin-like phospholipase family protein [Alphaproteobacteria bacterium]|nr:patatin-like phospholipase family protein [Alphaproteobacteria bacterium]
MVYSLPTDEIGAAPRIGLALGGGVARGWAHIGVVQALHEIGLRPDIVCGTSIGALVGGCELAGHLGALEDWARSLTKRKMLGYLDLSFSGGLLGGDRLVEEMLAHIGPVNIEELERSFAAIATDLGTGHEVWLTSGPLHEAMRASFGLPGVFEPVKLNGRWLIDGALTNPVPVTACRALGANVVIAVTLAGDWVGKVEMFEGDVPRAIGHDVDLEIEEEARRRWFNPAAWVFQRLFARKAHSPSLFGTMSNSLGIVLDRISRSRLAGDPPDVLLTPRLGHMGLFEFDRPEEAIRLGHEAVMRMDREILAAVAAAQRQGL